MLGTLISKLSERVTQEVWNTSADLPAWRRMHVFTARIIWVIGRDLLTGQTSLRAMSLVYTTLLSLVPVLALIFAVLKAFGIDDRIEVLMLEFLAPMGDQGKEITAQMITFVQQVNISVLGSVGLIFLIYTLISLIQKIEAAFNAIWHVSADRSIGRQVTAYLSAGLLGPLLLFLVAGAIATSVSSFLLDTVGTFEPLRATLDGISKLAPYAIMIAVFTFLYLGVPNTRVRPSAALVGGLFAGIMWVAVGWGFATFVVTSARYAAVYSAFASLVLFMIWLYAAWLILLVGCSITYYFQNRGHLSPDSGIVRLTLAQMERLSLILLTIVHRSFLTGDTPWTLTRISNRLGIPTQRVNDLVEPMRATGLVAWAGQRPCLVPTKPAEMVKVVDLLKMMVRADRQGAARDERLGTDQVVDELFVAMEAAAHISVGEQTLADLIRVDKIK